MVASEEPSWAATSLTAQSLKNIQAILAQQEMTLANVVKTTVFLADINDFAEMNKVYGEYFAQPYPARSAVQVGKLPKDAPLEIECIAVKDLPKGVLCEIEAVAEA